MPHSGALNIANGFDFRMGKIEFLEPNATVKNCNLT